MAYHIKDPLTDRKLRELARVKGKTMAASLREAIDRELAVETKKVSLWDRLAPARKIVADARTKPGPLDWENLKQESDKDWRL